MIHYIMYHNVYFTVDEIYTAYAPLRRVSYFLFARMSGKIWQTGCLPLGTCLYYTIIMWAVEPWQPYPTHTLWHTHYPPPTCEGIFVWPGPRLVMVHLYTIMSYDLYTWNGSRCLPRSDCALRVNDSRMYYSYHYVYCIFY